METRENGTRYKSKTKLHELSGDEMAYQKAVKATNRLSSGPCVDARNTHIKDSGQFDEIKDTAMRGDAFAEAKSFGGTNVGCGS